MTTDDSLDGVFSLLESHGTTTVFTRELESLASVDARAALHAAGVVAAAPAVPTWPCDVRGCSREIRSNYDGARKPLVAVCSQAPPSCMPVELAFDEVAQQKIAVDALIVAVCTLLGATIDRAAMTHVRERHAVGETRAPVLVAKASEPRRDVFWAGSPRDMDLAAWCARRERADLPTLVLVPTTKHVPLEVASRFAAGETVEVRALSHVVEVRESRLAIVGHATPPAQLPREVEPAAPAAHGIAAVLGVTRWEEIRITVVDAHTVSIEAKEKKLLRTFVELGFVDARKREVVTPVTAWGLLILFCKQGRIKPSAYREFGKPYGVKKAIERIGAAMREAFGLAQHPIHSYSKRARLWEVRFRVSETSSAEASRVSDASFAANDRGSPRREARPADRGRRTPR